jgi:hypothetical protein
MAVITKGKYNFNPRLCASLCVLFLCNGPGLLAEVIDILHVIQLADYSYPLNTEPTAVTDRFSPHLQYI